MKKIFLFCILLLMVSCYSIQYDGEVRLAIQGQIVDSNNNPIPNTTIDIAVYREDSYIYDLISYGQSDDSGNFMLIIPAPKGSDDLLEIAINQSSDAYQKKNYKSIKNTDFKDYKIILPTTILYSNSELATLEIETSQTNSNKTISEIRVISGLLSNEIVEFNPPLQNYTHDNYLFQVLRNQTVVVSYKVKDNSQSPPITTQLSDSIVIENSNVNHLINY